MCIRDRTENNKFITLTYINNHIEKIAVKIKEVGYRIAFKQTRHNTKQNRTYFVK